MESALTTLPSYNAVADLLDRNVAEGRGEKPAFVDPAREVTYSELQASTCRFANLLRRMDIRREQRIAMIMLEHRRIPNCLPRRDPSRRCADSTEHAAHR